MSLHKRNPSHISIYDYPEHLNPFYEDDNRKRLRFWKFSKKKNDGNGKHSLSIKNLLELWKSFSFRKKKSSTLGINKTSESPPILRRDLKDNSYMNFRIFRGDRPTSLQNIDTRRESDSNGMFFHRNVGYRSTTQFSGYTMPRHRNIRSSQSSLCTNPFESDAGSSCPSSPMSTRKQYRKKRRAPAPPNRSTIPEIEEFVNNRNESTINPEVKKEVVVEEKLSVTVPVSDIEPNPSTSKAPPQSNGSAIRTVTEKVELRKPTNEVFQPEEQAQNGDESIQDRKTNSFGTVKQISQIFEENISSSSKPKASSPKPENLNNSNASPPPPCASPSTTQLATKNNLFISIINKVKGPYRESSPRSSNLYWNPVPKPKRAHHQHSPIQISTAMARVKPLNKCINKRIFKLNN